MLAHAIESRKGCREEECSGREMAGTVEKCPWVLLIFKVNPKWLLIACHFFQPAFNHLKRISGKNWLSWTHRGKKHNLHQITDFVILHE